MRRLIFALLSAALVILAITSYYPTTTYAQQPAAQATQQSCDDATSGNSRNCTLSERIADPSGFVYRGWATTRSVINIVLLIALLLISFTNILRINLSSYEVKKALPNLVVGVLLANASFLVIKYLADIATVLVYFFVELADKSNSASITTFPAFVSEAISQLTKSTIDTLGIAAKPFTALILIIVGIITIIGILWLAAILYLRLVVIYFLTILAPLAFVSYGIPGFDKYFKQWWQMFIKWMFMLVAMSSFFWLMLVISDSSGSGNNSIANTIMQYVIFFSALTLPSKLGGKLVDNLTSKLKNNVVTTAGKNLGKDAGNWTASRLPGVYRTQEWLKLRKQNFDNDIKNRRDDAARKAKSGDAGQREKDLEAENFKIKTEEDIQKIGKERLARSKKGIGLKLEELANEKILLQAGLDTQKAQEQRAALIKNDMGKKLTEAEYMKTQAEAQKNAEQNKQKLEYVEDDKNREFLERVYGDVKSAEHLTNAVSTTEKIIQGGISQDELRLAKYVKAYHNSNNAAEKQRIKNAYDELRKKPGHSFFADKEIDTAGLKDNKILEAKQKQASKDVDGGIRASNEEAIKSQTWDESTEDLKKLKGKLGADYDRLASGDTVGIESKHQFQFQAHVDKLQAWARDKDHANSAKALEELWELSGVRTTGMIIKVKDPKDPQNTIDKPVDFAHLDDLEPEERIKVLSKINSANQYIAGSASFKTAHVK